MQNQTYSFDAMGNRTAKTDNVTGKETYTFDDANRIATRQVGASAVTNYSSDANGNTLTDATHTNQWDSQNRLVSSLSNGKTSAFKYGADGLRRKFSVTPTGQSQATTITHYGYDGSNVVREWEENIAGVLYASATYLLGPSGPMYKRPANAADVRWYVYDGLGSVVGEVDVNGTLQAEKKHDVFGLRRGPIGTEKSRHGFVGGLGHYSDDETGLVYMQARYYDPAIGRFTSEDPARDGANWFNYCGGDPVNMVDETGKSGERLNQLIGKLQANNGTDLLSKDPSATKSAGLTAIAMALGVMAVLLYSVAFGADTDDLVRELGAGGIGGALIGGIIAGEKMGGSLAAGATVGFALPVLLGTGVYGYQLVANL
ncbi:MAG: RHS repeat-associated core domain-containing protein [Fibrella sp.]|nr:RHS repeat-associated core domain-containing protein [Armatimonadota bacterium]